MANRIGINLLYLNPKLAGGSFIYAINLVNNLAIIDHKTQYVIYLNKDCENLPFVVSANFIFRILPFRYTSVYKRYLWEQFVLPYYILRDGINLLHSLGYVGPILCSAKKVTSILDINYKGHGASMNRGKKILLGSMIYLTAKTSRYLITISEFSKQQIIKYIGFNVDRVKVTLLSGMTDAKNENNQSIDVKSIYGIKSDYIIAFSSPSPHKNINRLIEAFALVHNQISEIKLVLVGYKTKVVGMEKMISDLNLDESIVFTGFVPDEHVKPLIATSTLFVFPSLYEGFGIPILDAQADGVAVASSNAGSLPEVGGDSPLYFNPLDVENMAAVMLEILNEKILREKIIKNGLINRARFSWKKTAEDTLAVYNEMY
ncbi:glycosyltransferase [Pedobacter sp. LMG 31464]|uniref:Glycosyltransferase n=1 Tax=Pedobacter planticolens TaxID=2679964 RepID=A0A923IUG9_9SPHI|nr:glycosyltransferase family 1 protein [Pedobacter planticolens]MBB2145920.1 glycosyltransferase [Pedobacter planticolens]